MTLIGALKLAASAASTAGSAAVFLLTWKPNGSPKLAADTR